MSSGAASGVAPPHRVILRACGALAGWALAGPRCFSLRRATGLCHDADI